MSSSGESYHTPENSLENTPENSPKDSPEKLPQNSPENPLKNSPENPPASSPENLSENLPENSSENVPAEDAAPHAGDIEPVNASNTIYDYTRLEGDQRLGSPLDPAPRYYPVYNLKYDSAMEPETCPLTILFKRSPIDGLPNVETKPLSLTSLIDASFSTDRNSPPQEKAAKFGLWIADEPGRKTIVPPGSWVFFPIIGAKS